MALLRSNHERLKVRDAGVLRYWLFREPVLFYLEEHFMTSENRIMYIFMHKLTGEQAYMAAMALEGMVHAL